MKGIFEQKLSSEDLANEFNLTHHSEGGKYVETHYKNDSSERATSGSIYYYVAPGETTKFHVIDCDEYWSYNNGAPLEVAMIDENGEMTVEKLGIEKGCQPTIYMKKGTIFASKNKSKNEGTYLTCITVPRFKLEGFKLFSNEEIIKKYPQTKKFLNS